VDEFDCYFKEQEPDLAWTARRLKVNPVRPYLVSGDIVISKKGGRMKKVFCLTWMLSVFLFFSNALAEKVVVIPLGGDTTEVYSTINWRGEWEAGVKYVIGDGVQNSGSSYICILEHTSSFDNDPPYESHWSLLASKGDTGGYTVTSAGQVWMNRNLGALRAAMSSNDEYAYGALFQWGRLNDGHAIRTSSTTGVRATSDTPGHSSFILSSSSPYDWRDPQNDNLWQGVSGVNNPCPAGFRLPTATEWETELNSWGTDPDPADAFASPLKLVVAGYRSRVTSGFGGVGSIGYYWSSTVVGIQSRTLFFNSDFAKMHSDNRANGFSVRCLED
jgi:uncharacterized protein (TIGR02145 family)